MKRVYFWAAMVNAGDSTSAARPFCFRSSLTKPSTRTPERDKGLNRCRNDATPVKDRGHGGKAGGWVLDMLLEQGGCFALVDDCSGVIDQPETADGI